MSHKRERYLVGPRNPDAAEKLLGDFVRDAQELSSGCLVKGPASGFLVVELSEEQLARLRDRYDRELIIERDAPLTY